MQLATREAAEWWARPRTETAETWIANYQRSLGIRHRVAISQIIGRLGATSVLEIGAHCGPNLLRLALDHPGLTHLHGFDVNAAAVAAGNRWAVSEQVADRVQLAVGAFPAAVESLPSASVDVVLSCYVLAYTAPEDIDAALYEVGRIARRAIVIAEPMTGGDSIATRMSNGYQEWTHNFERALPWIGSLRGMTAEIVPIRPPVDRLNGILVVARGDDASNAQ